MKSSDFPQKFFTVYHIIKFETYDFVKVIGMFSTKALARTVIRKKQNQPGFKDFKRGFQIVPEGFDTRHRRDGFARVGKIDKKCYESWKKPIVSKRPTSSKKAASAFTLTHLTCINGYDDQKLIGNYRTLRKAKADLKKFNKLPGFKDYPTGFTIDKYFIDQDCWPRGFSKVRQPVSEKSKILDLRRKRKSRAQS